MECPNCGYSFFFCRECGELCSDDEEHAESCIHGQETEGEEGYICDNCLEMEKEESEEEGEEKE